MKSDEFKSTLLKAMQDHGLEAQLKNSIYRWVKIRKREFNLYDSFFRKCQIHWEKRIHKSLNSMCSELGINLAKLRSTNEREEILNKWGELSNYEVGITCFIIYLSCWLILKYYRLIFTSIDQFMLPRIF